VLERVTSTVREHDMLQPGDLVLVCVSGGPDSVCLLHALWRLRRLLKIQLAVFHFDHRLREASAHDARYVSNLATRLEMPFHLRIAHDRPALGRSTEAWARAARMTAAGEVLAEIGATRLADGHTRDDQAETVLMALVLGWGLSGMSGIVPVNGVLVRPLLDVTRDEVEACCRALGLRPRRDPSNDDTSMLRNAIRLEAIPAIERSTGRRVRDTFARTAGLLRQDAEALWKEAVDLADGHVEAEPGAFRIRPAALRALPRPMASRVVRRAFQLADLAWTEDAIDAVLDLAAGRPGRRRDLAHGSLAERDRGHVRVHGRTLDSRFP
jgi:tRNA(Ile)-lysidine synthase